jgi:tRNA nucleotidyltransferase (CCA-adding enzyme)
MRCKISNPMTTEQQLRERLRKIAALFEGATTVGERNAAAAAIDRVKRAIDATSKVDTPVEYHFNFPDHWKRRLFSALCRRYGLEPYRYRRQRHTTVMVKVPKSFVDRTLWPEYLELSKALNEYLEEATERIIREEVYGDSEEAAERDARQ